MRYIVQTRDSPKASWKQPRFGRFYDLAADAINWARDVDEQGGCGPIRVIQLPTKEVVWTPAADRA